MAESLTVSWDWQATGQLSLIDGRLAFPNVPDAGGVYRFTFFDANGKQTGVYVGEAVRLQGRFRSYRTPGPTQLTNLRMNPIMTDALTAGGRVTVEVVTEAHTRAVDGTFQTLDLSWKTARVLVERAAELLEHQAGMPVLNR